MNFHCPYCKESFSSKEELYNHFKESPECKDFAFKLVTDLGIFDVGMEIFLI